MNDYFHARWYVDLVEFLLARIAEDEEAARAASPGPWRVSSEDDGRAGFDPRLAVTGPDAASVIDAAGEYCGDLWLAADESDLVHLARHDPARVLAECEAKRRIVEWCAEEAEEVTSGAATSRRVLRLLALPYAGHEDYREEWRPEA